MERIAVSALLNRSKSENSSESTQSADDESHETTLHGLEDPESGPEIRYPWMTNDSKGGRPSSSMDEFRYYTHKELVEILNLPRGFRFRDSRRQLMSSLSTGHRSFIESRPLHRQHIIRKLPRKLTLAYFSSSILLLTYHYVASTGRYPSFWSKSVEEKISHNVGSEWLSQFDPSTNGMQMYLSRAMETEKDE